MSAPAQTQLPPGSAFPPLNTLRAFDAVARLGGVRRAAEALSLDHAAISRHLRALEIWTGVDLVVKTGRGIRLTESAWRYHKQLAPALAALADATLSFIKQNDQRHLVVWCRPGFAAEWLMPRLDRFRCENPDIEFELRPCELAPNFARHEADVFVEYTSSYSPALSVPPGARMMMISRSPIIPLASPKYLSSSPPIREPRDLLGHPLIEDELDDPWCHWFASCGVEEARRSSGPRFWHAHLALDAARRSHGVLLAVRFLAEDNIAAGKLVQIMGAEGAFAAELSGTYWFLAREDAWESVPVARFRDWLTSMVSADAERR